MVVVVKRRGVMLNPRQIYVSICMYVNVWVCLRACMCLCVGEYLYLYLYIYICISRVNPLCWTRDRYMCLYVCMHMCVCLRACMCLWGGGVSISISIYLYLYIYIYRVNPSPHPWKWPIGISFAAADSVNDSSPAKYPDMQSFIDTEGVVVFSVVNPTLKV